MIIEFIFLGILVLSLVGMAMILFRKIPDLNKLPEPSVGVPKILVSTVKEKARKFPVLKDFSYELYLQKLLSKIRILTLKTESKTGSWLERLRQKNHQNHSKNDKYWDELKKAKEGK